MDRSGELADAPKIVSGHHSSRRPCRVFFASQGMETFHALSTLAHALFCCRLVSSFAQTPQCEAPTNEPGEGAAPPYRLIGRPPSDRRTKNHASSINSSGRVGTRLLQGIAIGAIASMAIGFSWGGWMLGSTANRHAAEQASTAVVAVLTPICVEKFLQNSDAQANLAALREIPSNWQQGQYLEKGGWATRPGATSSDYELARACAAKLIEAKAASQ